MCQSLSLCLSHSLEVCCQIECGCRAPHGGECPKQVASNGLLAWLHAIEKQIYWFKCFHQESNPLRWRPTNTSTRISRVKLSTRISRSDSMVRIYFVGTMLWPDPIGKWYRAHRVASHRMQALANVSMKWSSICHWNLCTNRQTRMDVSASFDFSFICSNHFEDIYILLFETGPQIVFSLYGTNWWGTETSKGYARIHVPLGGSRTTIRAPILIAQCTNIWSSLSSWFTDRNPELRDPKTLLDGTKVKGLNMQTYGELVVTLQSITKGSDTLCLEWS